MKTKTKSIASQIRTLAKTINPSTKVLYTKKEIAKELGKRYQHVYNVLKQESDQIELSKLRSETESE